MESENINSPRNFLSKNPKKRISRIVSERCLRSSSLREEVIDNGNEVDKEFFKVKKTSSKKQNFDIPLLDLHHEDGFLKEFLPDSKIEQPLFSPTTQEMLNAKESDSQFRSPSSSHSSENYQSSQSSDDQSSSSETGNENSPLSNDSSSPHNNNNSNNNNNNISESADQTVSLERINMLKEKQLKVAVELINTERTYLNNLTDLLRVFYDPMYANATGPEEARRISIEDVKHIFSNLRVIISINNVLYNSLAKRLSDSQDSGAPVIFGDIFLSQAEYLKTYTIYCNEYININAILKKNLENPEFESFFSGLHDKSIIGDQRIQNFLILPVQRIPRYRLLLQEMLKYSWKGHPDTELGAAFQKISKIADFIEKAQERYSNMVKIIAIQSSLKLSKTYSHLKLLQPHRSYVSEHNVDVQELVPGSGHVIRRGRKIFVFNDLFLISENISNENEKKNDKNEKRNDLKSSKRKRKDSPTASRTNLVKNITYLIDVISIHPVVFEGKPSLSIIYGESNMTLIMESEAQKEDLLKSLRTLSVEAKNLIKHQLNPTNSNSNNTNSNIPSSPSKDPTKRLRGRSNSSNKTIPSPRETVTINPLQQLMQQRKSFTSTPLVTCSQPKLSKAELYAQSRLFSSSKDVFSVLNKDIISNSGNGSEGVVNLNFKTKPGVRIPNQNDKQFLRVSSVSVIGSSGSMDSPRNNNTNNDN